MSAFWTDYPFVELGDMSGAKAPVRECKPVSYDGDKYLTIEVEGVRVEVKRGYVYKHPGRCGEVPVIGNSTLRRLRRGMKS